MIQRAVEYQKVQADKHRTNQLFEVGDPVLLSTKNISLMSSGNKATHKLARKFIGPFKIIEKINDVAYKLDLPMPYHRIHNVFHVSLLEKYDSTLAPDNEPEASEPEIIEAPVISPPVPSTIVHGVIRAPSVQIPRSDLIVPKRFDSVVQTTMRDGKPYHLVKWKDLPEHENSWLTDNELAFYKMYAAFAFPDRSA